MDAVGLVSSIISILDLTAKIISRTREYVNKTQNAPDYIRAITVHLPLLARALELVKQQALTQRIASEVSTELLAIVNNASDELRKLNLYVVRLTTDSQSSKLTKINRAVISVLKYDDKVEETLTKLKGYTDTLTFFQSSVATGKTEDILGYLRLIKHGQLDLQLQYERDNIKKWLAGQSRADYIDACIARIAPGTCTWVFDIPAYTAWLSSACGITDPHFLWIHGPPGVGKTFISAAIFAHLEAFENAAAVFWTSEGAYANATLMEIPRSWVSQLLTKNPATCEYLQPVWSDSKSNTALATEVWSALRNLVSSIGTVTLIIDGLDEYQQQQARRENQATSSAYMAYVSIREFLTALESTLQGVPCRVLCVSQPDSEIKAELEAGTSVSRGFPHSYEHAITKSDSEKDIDIFAKRVIDNKLPKKSEQFRTDLSALIASKAEGQMLWIALQERETNQLRPSFSDKKLLQVIQGAPRGLDQLYEVNLSRINQLGASDKRRAWRLLRWIMYNLRPLTVQEILEAILIEDSDDFKEFPDDELPDDPDEVDVYGELRNLCGNFIAFDLNGQHDQPRHWQVRLSHSSVRTFLSQHLEQNEDGDNTSAIMQNTLFARLCIRYLTCANVWPRYQAGISKQLLLESHPFVDYAATYFMLHVGRGDRPKIEPLVRYFLLLRYNNCLLWRIPELDGKNQDPVALQTSASWWWWCRSRLTLAASLGMPKVVEAIWDADNAKTQTVTSNSGCLHAACYSNSLATVRVLLDQGFQVNQTTDRGYTPLHYAVTLSNLDPKIIDLLISKGADLNAMSDYGTPLHLAAWWGVDLAVESLLGHNADVTLLDHDGNLPLHNATYKGHKTTIQALLSDGLAAIATVNARNDNGATPLLLAAALDDRDIVEIVLQAGGDPTQIGYTGATPLLYAAERGKEDVFDLILNACVDISTVINNYNTWTGASLLHLAAKGGNLNIIQKLIEKGADVDKLDYKYRTPLEMAIQLGNTDVIDFLLARQTNRHPGLHRDLPIHDACEVGNKHLVGKLIRQGADLKGSTSPGWTPLAWAVWNGHVEVVELILQQEDGKDTVNMKTSKGWTPLHMACNGAYVRIIDLLLENGADILATAKSGFGPMCFAAESGKPQAVQALLDRYGSSLSEPLALHEAAWSGAQDVFDLVRTYYAISDTKFASGAIMLHCAAYGGNVDIINAVLEAGDPDQLLRATSKPHETILSWATRKKCLKAAELILNRSSELIPPLEFDDLALHAAIEDDNLELVKLLYETDPEAFKKGRTPNTLDGPRPPLHQACYHGRAEIMQFLIGKDFRVLDCDEFGRSCLHYLAQTGHDNVSYLFHDIDWKAALAVVDEYGVTPLFMAAFYGQSPMFRWFVRQGSSVRDRLHTNIHATSSSLGKTLLHAAASSGNSEIAGLIIDTCGKDCLNWRSLHGEHPAHVAAYCSQHLFLEYLLEQGASIDVLTLQSETPLFYAVAAGSELVTAFLLGHGAASLEKQLGSPVLAYAAVQRYPFILNSLLDHGFESGFAQEDGVTLLHLAASSHSSEIIEFLLAKGLKWESRDRHGWKARDCLETSRFLEGSGFENLLSDGPRSWLHCSGWAFSASETAWFVRDGATTAGKIRDLADDLVETNPVPASSEACPVWTLTADHYLLPSPTGSYFETTILKCPSTSAIGIGLAYLVGEHNRGESYCPFYYGDSGWGRNVHRGCADKYAYCFGQGDTIGCGIDYKAGNVFFTKNGKCLGCAAKQYYRRLTPAIFSMERSLAFEGNFGQKPFMFDIARHGWDNEEKCKKCYVDGELYLRVGQTPDEDDSDEEGRRGNKGGENEAGKDEKTD